MQVQEETGDPRENPPTTGVLRHDSHERKFGSDSVGNRARFAMVAISISHKHCFLTKRGGAVVTRWTCIREYPGSIPGPDISMIVGVQSSRVHFIGHSLGAHIGGYAGHNLHSQHDFKLGRITGENHSLQLHSTKMIIKFVFANQIGTGMKGLGKREIPEKTRRPTTSSDTIPTCGNPVTRPGIEPGPPKWEASVLIAQPPWPLSWKGEGEFISKLFPVIILLEINALYSTHHNPAFDKPSRTAFVNSSSVRSSIETAKLSLSLGERTHSTVSWRWLVAGMDPAAPHFSGTLPEVRLDPTDADFVDVIHSDISKFITGGFGMGEPTGHVDFYPNGGEDQPGCDESVSSYFSLGTGFVEGFRRLIGCNHIRSYEYFTESVNSGRNCSFMAVECSSWEEYQRGACFACSTGDESLCAPLGFHADSFLAGARRATRDRVKLFLTTGSAAPHCRLDVTTSDVLHKHDTYVPCYGTYDHQYLNVQDPLGFLEDVPLHVRQNTWFQHDGAPTQFSLAWIGRSGPIAWPARSPDLTPLDYFLWGHMMGVIYETHVESEEDLLVRIMAAADVGHGTHKYVLQANSDTALVYSLSTVYPSLLTTFEATVAERLDCTPPTKANRVRYPVWVTPRFSQVGIMQRDSSGRLVFSEISRFPYTLILTLLHTHLTSPSSALKTSMLRAA
ncbi:hypothetical protein PR048_008777 [Dryococelus australis]|uniref:Lipase domain-containing protein n=1 Tax=Dryococelus australis TaxID=614101 RepID=A0ABQ9HY39_9NEOP|nr:hypothetical protein PR048_008777 [Dryococelus australis]